MQIKKRRKDNLKNLFFQLIIEAIPVSESNQARRYRGYMAVDDIVFKVNTFKIIFIYICACAPMFVGLLSQKIVKLVKYNSKGHSKMF